MAIFSPNLKKLQALMMVEYKLRGLGTHQIAKEMNISHDTVERRLAWANKAGLFVALEKKILDELVPVGFKAIKTAMEDGDSETAMELFKSLGILRDPKAERTKIQVEEDNSLQEAIKEIKVNEALTIEGEVLSGGRSSLAGFLLSSNSATEAPSLEGSIGSRGEAVEVAPEAQETDSSTRHEIPHESSEDGFSENKAEI